VRLPVPDVPRSADFGDTSNLDVACAVENFLGKSYEQALEMFEKGYVSYWEDLMWMKSVAFKFYIRPAIDYIVSGKVILSDDVSSIDGFILAIGYRLEDNSALGLEDIQAMGLTADVMNAAKYLAENFRRLPSSEAYEEMLVELERIRETLERSLML
jgi:hypothetical protein